MTPTTPEPDNNKALEKEENYGAETTSEYAKGYSEGIDAALEAVGPDEYPKARLGAPEYKQTVGEQRMTLRNVFRAELRSKLKELKKGD